jgi:hypothetical protein
VSQPTRVQGWSELLLALPEFISTHAHIDEDDEFVAHVELPLEVQPCTRCETIAASTARLAQLHRAPPPLRGTCDPAGCGASGC